MRGRFGDAIVQRDHARHLLLELLHVLGEGVTRAWTIWNRERSM
jgi:hypothetical protein